MASKRLERTISLDPGAVSGPAQWSEQAPALRISDAKLIETFLLATNDLPLVDAARSIGESPETLLSWRRGEARATGEGLRFRILIFLATRSMEPQYGRDAGEGDSAFELPSSMPVA